MRGEVIELVVAYKDRLARFGTDIIRQVLEFNGGKLVVLNEVLLSPEQ
jgi:predicted site-specific integrase-resolvase